MSPIISGVVGIPNLLKKYPSAPTANAICKSNVEAFSAYAPKSAKVVIPP